MVSFCWTMLVLTWKPTACQACWRYWAARMAAGELVEPKVKVIGPPLVFAAALTSLAAWDGL